MSVHLMLPIFTPCLSIIAAFLGSIFAVRTRHGSRAATTTERIPPSSSPHTHTHTHPHPHANSSTGKPALTQDSTLRMVCGCLAKVIGSMVDPARPAPNDPTPSIFCGSRSLALALSLCAPRGSTLPAPRQDGCAAALCCRDGSCAHPEAREHRGGCRECRERAWPTRTRHRLWWDKPFRQNLILSCQYGIILKR